MTNIRNKTLNIQSQPLKIGPSATIQTIHLVEGSTLKYYQPAIHETHILINGSAKINNNAVATGEPNHAPPGTLTKIHAQTNCSLLVIETGKSTNREKKDHPKPKFANQPEISIILAAYNVENYIAATLTSLLEQDHESFEIIAINDASTDETKKIIDQFASLYKNIRCYENKNNIGQALSRKRGLSKSSGQYYIFCDADDILAKNTISLAHTAAKESGADCVIFGFDHLDNDSGQLYNPNSPLKISKLPPCLDPQDAKYSANLAKISHITTTCLLERKIHAPWMLSSLHPLPFFEDIATFGAMVASSRKIHLLDAPLYHYRTGRADQATNDWFKKDRGRKILAFLEATKRTMESTFLTGASRKTLAHKLLRIIYWELRSLRKIASRNEYELTIAAFKTAAKEIRLKDSLSTTHPRISLLHLALKTTPTRVVKIFIRRVKIK